MTKCLKTHIDPLYSELEVDLLGDNRSEGVLCCKYMSIVSEEEGDVAYLAPTEIPALPVPNWLAR